MKPGPASRSPRFALLSFLVLSLAPVSCGLDPRSHLLPNLTPEVTLDRPTLHASGEAQGVALTWRGSDSDGRVDHYVFASDPRSVDRVDQNWTKTREIRTSLSFQRRASTGRLDATGESTGEPHVFAVRAVDDQGAMSAPATMVLFGTNIAPSVFIESPQPNVFFTPITPPSLDIRWQGIDQDGQITHYKYRLFTAQNPDFPTIPDFIAFALADPDAFRRMYAPGFAGWDSVGPDVQSVRYTNLTPNQLYMFAITAFDDAGDDSGVFSGHANLLGFFVTDTDVAHPLFCVSSPFFNHCPSSSRSNVELAYELPSETAIRVNWFANPSIGSEIEAYRWVLDPLDPADEKQRSHPTGDPNHWTPWDLQTTSATIGPFSRQEARSPHVLYAQVRDDFDRISTLKINFTLVEGTRAREILVVDDMRLTPDNFIGGTLQPPRGLWPSAAELDSFLYARGGHPWRGYPAGTLSTPGLLDGYDFDTLGTRGLLNGVVPLSLLNQYRQVIWMTDDISSTYLGSPVDYLQPITSLRLMSSPGQMNTLSAYVAQGGKLWLCGGGAAYATLAPWQRRNTPPDEFTNTDGELIEGRFMYDFAHWRSAVKLAPAGHAILNHSSLLFPWSAPGRGWRGQPNYGKLVAAAPALMTRTCATDPPPPFRQCDSFYQPSYFTAEFLSRPNHVLEDVDPRPNHEDLQSTLDTIYVAGGVSTPSGVPVMTYYHGLESGPVVFSGFAIWTFQRAQCATLVDFVLQDIWGLSRRTTAVASRQP